MNIFGIDLTGLGASPGDYENGRINGTLTTSPLDFSAASDVTLRFYRWLNVEEGIYDAATIEVSTNGGPWVEVWRNELAILDDDWTKQEVDLTPYAAGQPSVRVRWGLSSDAALNMSGWNLDPEP